jgi:hypothetical protein
MSLITDATGLRTTQDVGWHGYSWLDKYVAEQAAYYGMTPEKKAALFNGAADYDELILAGEVEEPSGAQNELQTLQ